MVFRVDVFRAACLLVMLSLCGEIGFAQHIICVLGAPSVGKSSICDALIKKDPNAWAKVAIDQVIFDIAREELGDAIVYSNSFPRVYREMQKRIGEEKFTALIEEQLRHGVQVALEKEKNVLLDVIGLGADLIEFLESCNCDVYLVLAYCSLSIQIKRFKERNSSNDATNHRTITPILEHLKEIFKPEEPDDQISCGILKKNEVEEAFTIAEKKIGKTEELDEFRSKFMRYFHLDTHDQVQITPRFDYDLRLDTGKLTPKESAIMLCAIVDFVPRALSQHL